MALQDATTPLFWLLLLLHVKRRQVDAPRVVHLLATHRSHVIVSGLQQDEVPGLGGTTHPFSLEVNGGLLSLLAMAILRLLGCFRKWCPRHQWGRNLTHLLHNCRWSVACSTQQRVLSVMLEAMNLRNLLAIFG